MRSSKVDRILAIDDHPLPLEITCAVLRKVFDGATVQAAISLGEGLRYCAESGSPQVAILDLGLPGCSGIEALSKFRGACPDTAVVIFSATEDGVTVRSALRAGARGYIPKSSSKELMQAALRVVAQGGIYVPPEALGGIEATSIALTERERDVLQLILRGRSNRDIGSEMGISETTVKHHAGAVFRALGVSSRAEAIVAARQKGIDSR